jgi:glycosyltransferase involved in cell wall biosynthesis
MKILLAHSRYALRGGEDQVFEAERDLLRAYGHHVVEYVLDNKTIQGGRTLLTGLRTVWSQPVYRAVRALIREHHCHLVHVHNFFPLLSPSIYYAAHAEGIPAVQTLHSYRLICPAGSLFRGGELCQECVGKTVPLPAIKYGCYRQSRVQSAAVAGMCATHTALGTWNRRVTRYIALTDFVRDRYIAGGFPAERIAVKPNFAPDTGVGTGDGKFFVFVGRLSPEKGVSTLLRAWSIARPPAKLLLIGSGPEEANLRVQAARLEDVQFLGHLPPPQVQQYLSKAIAAIVPSVWLEPFGLSVIEALALGTPVLASDVGGISSLIRSGRSGYLFSRGDAEHLARLLNAPASLRAMRNDARAEYLARFTPEHNYHELRNIYAAALAEGVYRESA